MSVLLAHRDEPAPALPPGVPAGLRDLVNAMLDKDPAKRPTDGRAIAAQAERFNAPTVSIPVLVDPYPAAAQRDPSPSAGATGVLAAPEMPAPRRSRRGLLLGAVALAVVGALVAALVVVGTRGHGGASRQTAAPPAPPKPVHVASVSPYAGSGGSADHPEEASLATDGNPSTSWYTQHYASAAFGGLRSGAGLLLDLGQPVAVRTLKLRLSVAGVTMQVHAADSVAALMSSPVVGSSASAPAVMTLHPGKTARYWLVWFTKLASNDGAYRAGIAEASFAR